ncbi:MAG: hypothetical protein JWP13_69 [Candidatus Saccharibacteria bacterium]|nr:hypothetical protein [Candidatus Saccharibacteria bacterium]
MKRTLVAISLSIVVVGAGLAIWKPSHVAPPASPKASHTHASAERSSSDSSKERVVRTQSSAPTASNTQSSAEPISGPVREAKKLASMVTIGDKQYPRRTYQPLAMPNDPMASQWWVSNTRLDQAWDIPSGGAQTVLAVIDSGFALNHEEFAGRWYGNAGESGSTTLESPSMLNCAARSLPLGANCNLIDDDNDGTVDNETGAAVYQNPSRLNCTDQGRPLDKSCNRRDDESNGYVDDTRGWDFINYDNSVQAGELNPAGEGTTHGTRVAGIAAASGNNGKGMAGVDWNTKILPIQALDDDSYGDTLSVGRSIYYAIAQKADVISLSLGSDLPDAYVREAVQAALAAGIVVVAASGNDGCDCMVYPANYPEVVAVGALNPSSQVASFSSYGSNLDILAPGVNMVSANWQADNSTSAYVSGINGTSFATPMIGGMLTRLKSQRPTATPAQLIAALAENVNRLGLSASVNADPHYGFGALDTLKPLNRMIAPKTSQWTYAFTPVSKGNRLDPAHPAEPGSTALVYACQDGVIGTTPIYELIKGDSHFFSLSNVEIQRAIEQGYRAVFVMYACLGQPHDTGSVVRSLNIFHEFRNTYPKTP